MDVAKHAGLAKCNTCGKYKPRVTRGGRCFDCVARLQLASIKAIERRAGPAFQKWKAGMLRAAR